MTLGKQLCHLDYKLHVTSSTLEHLKLFCTKSIWKAQVSADILGTTVGFSHYSSKGVDWVFVEHDSYDRPGGLYGDESGVYGDNQALLLPKLILSPPYIAELCHYVLVAVVCLALFRDTTASLGVETVLECVTQHEGHVHTRLYNAHFN